MKFYTAGKTWHAPKFKRLRDDFAMPVLSRWIDLGQDSDIVKNRKGDLWEMCREDVSASDFVLLYSENFEEEQRGALVEIGMAIALNKPIYAVGHCKSIVANEKSDVAFTHHSLWTWVPEMNLVRGAFIAYATQMKMLSAKSRTRMVH